MQTASKKRKLCVLPFSSSLAWGGAVSFSSLVDLVRCPALYVAQQPRCARVVLHVPLSVVGVCCAGWMLVAMVMRH